MNIVIMRKLSALWERLNANLTSQTLQTSRPSVSSLKSVLFTWSSSARHERWTLQVMEMVWLRSVTHYCLRQASMRHLDWATSSPNWLSIMSINSRTSPGLTSTSKKCRRKKLLSLLTSIPPWLKKFTEAWACRLQARDRVTKVTATGSTRTSRKISDIMT